MKLRTLLIAAAGLSLAVGAAGAASAQLSAGLSAARSMIRSR